MRDIARLAIVACLPLLASCADDERNPFDPAADQMPPSLVAFEIVTENQLVFATWSASEPVRAVVEYADPSTESTYHSYPAGREHAEAGITKLVGVQPGTEYELTAVRLTDRAGNVTRAEVEAVPSFTTAAVADEDLFYFAMIDVGWGDALYMEAPDGTNVLIDAGHPREPDARPPGGMHPVRWFLEKRRVTGLDFASLSHVHEDHIGGFYGNEFDNVDGLFQSHGGGSSPIPVGTFLDILDKTPGTINGPYADLDSALASLGRGGNLDRWVGLRTGASSTDPSIESLQWGANVRVDLLAAGRKDFLLPEFILGAELGSVQNNDSMVYRVQYGDFVIILMGDGEFATEQYIQDNYSPEFAEATVLKLGHHGSNDANSERYIRYVDPVIALIPNAVSENPGVEHPFVLGRLRNLGIDYFASDRVFPNRDRALPGVRGDVHLYTDGSAVTVAVDNIAYE